MSDLFEKFIRNNKEQFNQKVPSNELWGKIESGLAQGAGAGPSTDGGASSATNAVSGGISITAKIAAAIVGVVAIATTVWYVNSGNTAENSSLPAANEGQENNLSKVEHLVSDNPFINPPLPIADIRYETFTFNAKKGTEIRTKTGTVITVPKNIFVDKNGNPVKGDVTIRYREFHDGADIIMSGIPMTFDDNGKTENFQTAGMMEMRGFKDGEEIFIAEGEKIDISMASFATEDDYNLYFLDQKDRRWKDIGKAKLGKNKEREKGLKVLGPKPEKPLKPVKGTAGEVSENELTFDVDYSDFPELKPFKKIRWEAADPDFMKENEWIFTKVWTKVELNQLNAETMEYEIALSNKTKRTKITVIPVLEGKDYEKAMADFDKKMSNYKTMLRQREEEEKRLMVQGEMLRTFEVTGFGIYNCDRFYNNQYTINVNAEFKFDENIYLDPAKTKIYQIAGNNRAVLTHDLNTTKSIRFAPKDENYLVVILPDAKIGVVKDADFKKIDTKKAGQGQAIEFNFKASEEKVTSAADLRLLLGV